MALFGTALLCLGVSTAPASAAPSFSTNLNAEPGQTPPPSNVGPIPENCKGVAPATSSRKDDTDKEINTGQGLTHPVTNTYTPGGTVHFLVLYNNQHETASFDIRDCVVEFLPGNTSGISKYITSDHGEIVPQPGSEPTIKGYDAVLDNAQWEWADGQTVPGEFDYSWIIPGDAPPGAIICNYVKTTGEPGRGQEGDRKAGTCFTVQAPPSTTTTSTSTTSTSTTSTSTSTTSTSTTSTSTSTTSTSTTSTSTTAPPPTSTTTSTTSPPAPCVTCGGVVPTTTTTVPTAVLGESGSTTTTAAPVVHVTPTAAPTTTIPTAVLGESLPVTGGNVRDLVLIAGAVLLLGGLLLMGSDRMRPASAKRG